MTRSRQSSSRSRNLKQQTLGVVVLRDGLPDFIPQCRTDDQSSADITKVRIAPRDNALQRAMDETAMPPRKRRRTIK